MGNGQNLIVASSWVIEAKKITNEMDKAHHVKRRDLFRNSMSTHDDSTAKGDIELWKHVQC